MKRTSRTFSARRAGNSGSSEEITAVIDAPEYGYMGKSRTGGQNWFCRVRCPEVLGHERHIGGADARQASELAREFIEIMLNHYGWQLVE